jgi:hypothetical protein
MAILIEGMDCPICGRQLKDEDEKTMFTPFVGNTFDPLIIFSDATLHKECYLKHPLAKEAQRRYNEQTERNLRINRICNVCKNDIKHPDDYFGVGHLTNDSKSPLYQYNYLHLHRSCIKYWNDFSNFNRLIIDYRDSGKWGGKGLDYIKNTLEKSLI